MLWQIQSDLAWYPTWLGLPAHNSNVPCHLCACSKEELFSISRTRKPAILSAQEWHDHFGGSSRYVALFDVPGVSGLNVNPDVMHCKWLGTDSYLLGSAVCILHRFKFGRDLGRLIDALTQHLDILYFFRRHSTFYIRCFFRGLVSFVRVAL